MKFAKILVPIDYSTCSDHAVDVAQSLGRTAGGTVELVNVYPAPTTILPDGSALPVEPQALLAAQARADETMTAATRAFHEAAPDVAVDGHAVLGDVREEILALARSGRFDAIVMGTHGRTGLRRLLMGSVAEAIIRQSPIPVVAVRTPATATATDHVAAGVPAHS
jgi:nucleotide-binding universal stress UspA family protein